MWTKKSQFMLIKIKVPGRVGFTLPISLLVFRDLIESLADLGSVVKLLIPKQVRHYLEDPLKLVPQFFDELCRHKGLHLVDVEADGVKIKVDLL